MVHFSGAHTSPGVAERAADATEALLRFDPFVLFVCLRGEASRKSPGTDDAPTCWNSAVHASPGGGQWPSGSSFCRKW